MAKRTNKRTTTRAQGDGAKRDIFQEITDRFVKAIEEGIAQGSQWKMPWRQMGMGMATNVATRKRYRGVNVLVLGIVAEDAGQPALWGTFKQWASLGCQVRKGERATMGVYWATIKLRDENGEPKLDENGEEMVRMRPQPFAVFHIGQVTAPVRYSGRIRTVRHPNAVDKVRARFTPDTISPLERDERAEKILTAVGADVRHGGDRAFYSPGTDRIQLPYPEQFHDAVGYFGTWAHELGHWTGHASRLNRTTLANYATERAMEELTAELSATFTCQHLGIESEPREDHAQYLAAWAEGLKADKRALYRAASAAEKATAYLMAAAGVDMSDPEGEVIEEG